MSWLTEIIRIVRNIIDDTDSSTYSDARLEEAVLVGAQLTLTDVNFSVDYTIDVDECILSPDPTTSAPKDNNFINLVSLKTSCLILNSEHKAQASKSIKVVDGPSTIDLTGTSTALKDSRDNVCQAYESAKKQFQFDGSIGQAVLTPYTVAFLWPDC